MFFFCEWKTTGKSSIKARSLSGADWLLKRKPRLRLLGARPPGFRLAHRRNRDFIHKSVYSFGQRQEIRALERGNPPITNLLWLELEKQGSLFSPNHVCCWNDSTAGAQKVTALQYKVIQSRSNCCTSATFLSKPGRWLLLWLEQTQHLFPFTVKVLDFVLKNVEPGDVGRRGTQPEAQATKYHSEPTSLVLYGPPDVSKSVRASYKANETTLVVLQTHTKRWGRLLEVQKLALPETRR